MEWTTQSEEQLHNGNDIYTGSNGLDPQSTQPLPTIPAGMPPVDPAPGNSTATAPGLGAATPGHSAAIPAPPAHHTPAPPAASGHEQCPSCGAVVTSDQRYCLACGHRRGEPRLPFMDAVVFMDAMKAPKDAQAAPPPKKPRRISPNAALIAGVGTLLLALGIGVLIGHAGNNTAAAPQQAPIVIRGGAAGTGETATASSTGTTVGGGGKSTAGKSKKAVKKEKEAAAASGEGAEEVLKPSGDVKLPPPTTGVGDKCEKGAAGCEGGKFTGDFFK